MAESGDSWSVSFDAAAMQEAVEDTVDGTLRSLVTFDKNNFEVLYVDDLTRQFYDDEDQMYGHFEEIHSYVHVDFTEKSFYTEDLFPVSERVRYIATGFDVFTVVRIYFDEEGLFLTLDRDEPVKPIVAVVEEIYEGE
jgi:hypothetical protein